MAQQFFIIIHIRIKGELQSFGKFDLGSNKEAAYDLFSQLKGNSNSDNGNVLFMELTETVNNLPANIRILSCTLDQLAANCRTIAKQLFRNSHLGI
ncbi:hypothetical protein HHL16_19650 [Pseudoflavitalea sp. G-6-1-2]|uniref:hypothetical protein n=1 Tax=Pseudoflavitalea sp. G-6-1-2 TaxID=2728841 RepID=UPI00146CCC70|nr:hypothetical protein [Pseudoflavitalea sp. G-6-1-2]NML23102.1 hypothetical protein [Pseudoflavitalea sp. G-6-1-2]